MHAPNAFGECNLVNFHVHVHFAVYDAEGVP